jgi:transcription-repair coupling factor (superfamily II helicase)
MNDIVKILPNFKKFNDYISNVKDNTSPIMLSGLTDSGKVHFAYSTYFYAEKPICIITYNELQAKKIIRNLEYFENNINYFPKKEILAYDYLAESKDITYSRIACLNEIHKKQAKIIVTTIEAVSQKIIPEDVLYKNILELKIGDVINLEEIKQKLVLLGYERQDVVENKSEFSVRGGIIDVAISEKQGIRIELWGDEIDSIRTFDINTQRSLEKRENIKIYPAHEFLLDKPLEEVAKDIQDQRDKEEILEGNFTNKIDKYWNKFYNNPDNTFIDYIKDNYIIFIDEVSKIKARSENVIKDTKLLMQNLVEKKRYIPELLEKIEDYIEFLDRIKSIQTIYLENKDIGFVDKQSMHAKRNGYSFSYREVNFFRSSMDLLFKEVQEGLGQGTTIAILCGNQNNIKRTKDLLAEKINNPKQLQKLIITEGSLTEGFECYDFNLLVISIEELFNIPKKKRKTPEQFKAGETIIFSDLKVGDYIVHRTNGVGQFVGINTIQAAGVTKDYIKIKYKDDGILYVPTSSLDNVKKYIGSGDGAPRLNKLGSKDWAKAKARVKSNLQEIAKDLIELYAKREKAKGFMFSKDTEWQKEFEQKFPYTETNDQLRSIEEMKKDMESEKPMDRLLCRRCWVW